MPVLGSKNNVYGGIYQATASGAIANGKACIINANGTVSQAGPLEGGVLVVQTQESGGRCYKFTLATPFDTTATTTGTFAQAYSGGAYTYTYPTLETNMNAMHGFKFSADGTKFFALDIASTTSQSAVREFTLSTPYTFNVNTITSASDSVITLVDSFIVGDRTTAPRGLAFKTDGTEMYICSYNSSDVLQYTLSTGFDVSTASYTRTYDTTRVDYAQDITFKPDGTKMYITENTNEATDQYSLSTAWDISTASYDSVTLDHSAYQTSPEGIIFNNDGTKFYVVGDGHNDITEYTLSTAYALNTASFTADTDLYLSNWYGVGFVPSVVAEKSYVGISVGAVSDGQTASIRVLGGLDTNQSGLTPNALAYIQIDGSISSTVTDTVAGWALSPTTILIRGNYKGSYENSGVLL